MNAKEELLEALAFHRAEGVICAHIVTDDRIWQHPDENPKGSEIVLKTGHTPSDFGKFLSDLEIKYSDLIGTVWLDDGTWLTRIGQSWENERIPEVSPQCRP